MRPRQLSLLSASPVPWLNLARALPLPCCVQRVARNRLLNLNDLRPRIFHNEAAKAPAVLKFLVEDAKREAHQDAWQLNQRTIERFVHIEP